MASPDEMVLAAKEKGLRSIAITDHGHAHAHAQFHFACRKHGVKGLFGMEAYVIHSLDEWREMRDRLRLERAARKNAGDQSDVDLDEAALQDKQNRRILNRKGHLVLLARDKAGLSNIYQITHKAHKHGFYMKPRADKDMLRQHSRGVIASSACMGGVISAKIWGLQRGEVEWSEVVREAQEFDEVFGRGSFFLEVQGNEHENQRVINSHILRIHEETGIPLSFALDSHYVKEDDWEAQQLLHMLMSHRGKGGGGLTFNNLPEGYDFKVRSLFVKSAEEAYESFVRWNPDFPVAKLDEAFDNTLLIDSMIEPYEPDTSPRLPTLPYEDPMREVAERALESMKARGLASDERYTQRFLYEVGVISEKGIAPYFLVVQGIVEEAKKTMLIGPGRGSAAGSLICYLLGITNIDPIEHKLMFERFINVDRMELPDIDLDFEDVDSVKDVLRGMFGEDNVACISAYGTNQIKGLLKDVSRLHGIDHGEVNRANARIEAELKALYQEGETRSTVTVKLEDVYRLSPTFRAFIDQYPQVEKAVQRLYGRPHHVSRHASGVVIGDNLPAETAVFYSGKVDERVLQTSFTDGIVNKDLSNMGLVKFDILSLATLKVIRKTCELVAGRTGRQLTDVMSEIDPKRMDFNDMRVMEEVFHRGNLTGIFQCSQKGMRRLLQQVMPTSFEDVAAVCALYRPGPLGSGMDQMYARRKNGEEEVSYDHPILEEIMRDTYGCLIYQEQMLEIGRRLGNMSWKDVNRLRKLFLKKDKSKQDEFVRKEEDELKAKLIAGVVSHDMTEQQGEELWEMCGKFGGYGFNVAHAKSYGMVTMQTAYLRTYYPLEFLAAVLAAGQTGEQQGDVDDIRRQGFRVLPVDVNRSMMDYAIEETIVDYEEERKEGAIRLSLLAVKGIGAKAATRILANRPYTSLEDFLYRSGATKTSIVPLIRLGAMCSLYPSVGRSLRVYELFQELKGSTKKGRPVFEAAIAQLTTDEAPVAQLSAWERELLSFNILHSPFTMSGRGEKVQAFVDAGVVTTFDQFVEDEDETECRLAVVLHDWRERAQKNGQMMAFLRFGTADGREFEAPAFSGVWRNVSGIVERGELYIAAFNRKFGEDPQRLIFGDPGWAHTRAACAGFLLKVDDLE